MLHYSDSSNTKKLNSHIILFILYLTMNKLVVLSSHKAENCVPWWSIFCLNCSLLALPWIKFFPPVFSKDQISTATFSKSRKFLKFISFFYQAMSLRENNRLRKGKYKSHEILVHKRHWCFAQATIFVINAKV